MQIEVGIPISVSQNGFRPDTQHHRDRVNKLYKRLLKVVGERESFISTNEMAIELFDHCRDLGATITKCKDYVRPVPRKEPQSLEDAIRQKLGGGAEPEDSLLDEGSEIIATLFESSIAEIERHLQNGDLK